MDNLATCLWRKTNDMPHRKKEREEEDGQRHDSQIDKPCIQLQQQHEKPQWAPSFFFRADKDIYHYAGQDIAIEGAFDSFAGIIWPEALALCHYLDTHREELNLLDKAVLEIAAGTGLVSIVASLLGAWVTAIDIPAVLNKLRVNLSRNTRGRCQYVPQVGTLSWGCDLEHAFPSLVYRYDYVLVTSLASHQDFLEEFLSTMKHFCKPGTTLILVINVTMENDRSFLRAFKEAFHTKLLSEDGDMKIFMATSREEERTDVKKEEINVLLKKMRLHPVIKENVEDLTADELDAKGEDDKYQEDGNDSTTTNDRDTSGQKTTVVQQQQPPAWAPYIICTTDKDVYHYVGEDIVIHESIDSYGAVMWPAALALCSYLENNREMVNLQGKQVLELGSGTGLVAIVASLLGASVTATDLRVVLGNLRANVMRNTRGRCRHLPQVEVLSWGFELAQTHPTSHYRYDYVLGADVVYHHDYLEELLATMKHFCLPGTTVIWANRVRMESDLTFTENFKKTFLTNVLFEEGDMKIFMGTFRERERERERESKI